ncbi:hypothetical protein TCAL_14794 [Tigriopus californicus]|uniref:Uncharacterized protein n=1 Tax=Tigriopus californicus TaxID=6832 RepID=A0A553PNN6_TIGCA|nr:hypothetical protein TCAL_14794 [Tigriopus californicus]
MLNPLIHNSSSAPTSPLVTRSIQITGPVSTRQRVIRHTQSILASNILVTAVRTKSRRDNSPSRMVHHVPINMINGTNSDANNNNNNYQLPHHPNNNQYRRLSRLVKCRTLDFTEFPEGMREYAGYGPKRTVRISKSQPGSPVSIPRISVQDFDITIAGSERTPSIDKREDEVQSEPVKDNHVLSNRWWCSSDYFDWSYLFLSMDMALFKEF